MRKRLLTVLLAVILVIALGTITAFADDAYVSNESELREAISNASSGDTVVLTDDITVTDTINIENMSITLDLAGHVIQNNLNGVPQDADDNIYMGRVFHVFDGASLTVDGTADNSGMSIAESAVTNGFFAVDMGGNLTLNGGSYSGSTDTYYANEDSPEYFGNMIGVYDQEGAENTSTINLNDLEVSTNYGFLDTLDTIQPQNLLTVNVTDGTYTGMNRMLFHVDSYSLCPVNFDGVTAVMQGPYPVIELDGSVGTFDNCNFEVKQINSNGFSHSAIFVGYEGSATINSGIYTSVGVGLYIGTTGGQINVFGGTVSGGTYAAVADEDNTTGSACIINIYDGRIINGQLKTSGDNANIIVSGGTFSQHVDEEFCAPGFVAVDNGDGTYGVSINPDVDYKAQIVNSEGHIVGAYTTLNAAISDAGDGDTVTMLSNVTEDVVIPTGKTVTLDLNGYTLTNEDDHTITNSGTLTIIGDGTVDNVTHARAALYNDVGATATLSGGTFTRSLENGINAADNGGNSYYTILNHGTMTINDGVTVNQGPNGAGKYSSLIENGWQSGSQNTGAVPSVMTINGGNFSGGLNTIKNDDYGQLEIKDGTFDSYAQACVLNWNEATISGGEFDGSSASSSVVLNGYLDDTMDKGQLTITGGNFTGVYAFAKMDGSTDSGTIEVSGGNFTTTGALVDPDAAIDGTLEVSGGSYSQPVAVAYLAEGLNAELYSGNSQTPYSYYESVDDALAAAQPGDVVTDLTNVNSNVMCEVRVDYYGNGSYETLSVRSGSSITPVVPTRSGYRFAGWRDTQGNRYEAGQAITVYSDMTLTAMWNAVNVPDTTYPITIADTDNGTVSTNLTNASAGATITITAEPDEGYSVGRVVVTGPDGRVDVTRVNATTYTFKMPEGDVEVEVEFVPGEEALPFTDVTAGAWYYDAVSYVYFNGMMEGDSATTFNPDGTMTRAMFWAVLGRIDGASITGSNWAEAAREWAVTNGVSDGENASGLVTREQMVTMLWRYVGEPESSYSLSAYSDAASVSDWAEEAMSWALENGIVEGMTATTLEPQSTATRAQCATIFMRYDALEA